MAETCRKCNACTLICPIVEISKEDELYEIYFGKDINIWNCSSCFSCEEICPEDLSLRNEIFKARRSLKIEDHPRFIKKYYKSIKETGNSLPIDEDLINERRKKMGLEPIDFKKIKNQMKKLLDDSQ